MEHYIFAVTQHTDALEGLLPSLTGFQDAAVEAISHGGLSAVVCQAPKRKIRPRRKNLKIHHDTVHALTDTTSTLPMAFGMVAEGHEAVVQFLARHHDTLIDQLERLHGRAEMGLTVSWKAEDVTAHLVSKREDLQAERDRLFADGREPSRDEKIALGQTFAAALEAERHDITERLVALLSGACEELQVNEPRGDQEIARLAMLVKADAEDAVTGSIEAAARAFDDDILFSISGPIAPYSFLDLKV